MKFVIALLVASSGTCSVGGTTRLPPSPAEQAQSAKAPGAAPTTSKLAIAPECAAYAEPCDDCNDVEAIRREIMYRKCLPVCGAYLEQEPAIAAASEHAPRLLQSPAACGKGAETCTPLQNMQCEYMVGYVTSNERFLDRMRTEVIAVEELPRFLVEDLLTRYLEHHSRVNGWATANNLDPSDMLEVGGQLFGESQQYALAMVQRLIDEGYPRADELRQLINLAAVPGNPATFEDRRERAERPFR